MIILFQRPDIEEIYKEFMDNFLKGAESKSLQEVFEKRKAQMQCSYKDTEKDFNNFLNMKMMSINIDYDDILSEFLNKLKDTPCMYCSIKKIDFIESFKKHLYDHFSQLMLLTYDEESGVCVASGFVINKTVLETLVYKAFTNESEIMLKNIKNSFEKDNNKERKLFTIWEDKNSIVKFEEKWNVEFKRDK